MIDLNLYSNIQEVMDSMRVRETDEITTIMAHGYMFVTLERHYKDDHFIQQKHYFEKQPNGKWLEYNPDFMDKNYRAKVIHRFKNSTFTQSQIAKLLGVSQTTISNDLKNVR